MVWIQDKMNIREFTKQPLEMMTKISPSRYLSLKQCTLKEIWTSTRQPLLPRNPTVYLGTVTHRMLELTFKGRISNSDELSSAWDEEIQQIEKEMIATPLEKHLVPLKVYVLNFEVKKLLAFRMITLLFSEAPFKSKGGSKISPEAWVQTPEGKVCGKIDLIKETDAGVEIVDYKTGSLTEEKTSGSVKEEYLIQLKMYAALYHAAHGEWPVTMTLVGINQESISIDVDSAECTKLLLEAEKALEDTNELIEAGLEPEDFAAPSPEACKYCLFRPACSKYWETRLDDGNWPTDAWGQIACKTKLKNGLLRIVITSDKGDITIRGLSPERHTFLENEPKRAVFCNLWREKPDGFYVEKMFTTGYALE